MEQFMDDEVGYLQWVNTNPEGFVVNCNRSPSPSYLVLHRAHCGTIIGRPARGRFWTVLFIKICSLDRTELETWAQQQIGGNLRPCQRCNP